MDVLFDNRDILTLRRGMRPRRGVARALLGSGGAIWYGVRDAACPISTG